MNLTPEMILRGYQANTAALEEMIFVKGKVAIVTGGTSGLGFCVARRLCQGGAKVVLASSTQEKGDLAVRLLKEEGFDVIFCKTDVRSEEESNWSSLRWRPMVRSIFWLRLPVSGDLRTSKIWRRTCSKTRWM